MAGITGIGGVFLNLDTDIQQLHRWYRDMLGLDVSEYGINLNVSNAITLLTFNQVEDGAILNFAVDDLVEFMDQLRVKGVHVHREIIEQSFGMFAQIKDIAGNIIELSQLDEEKYRGMVEEEIEQYRHC